MHVSSVRLPLTILVFVACRVAAEDDCQGQGICLGPLQLVYTADQLMGFAPINGAMRSSAGQQTPNPTAP